MNQVLCEHPVIIINPKLPTLIAKYKHYVFRGEEHRVLAPRYPFDFKFKSFSVKKNGITVHDLDNCFVVDDKTGEIFPIYLQVPCGHCDVCKTSNINSFVHRCMLETEFYTYKPWFVTLTYDNMHVPKGGVSKRDLQLFLKRFRINLQRAGFSFFIRYVGVGEYGKNTHRPHYHLILWNIQASTTDEYLRVSDILYKSWDQGFINRRLIDPSDDKSFYYTAKYLKKDCFVPEGCNDTFILSSKRDGGIGAPFIDFVSDKIRKNLDFDFKFLSRWRNSIVKLQFSRYVLNRIFPTFCKSVSSHLRDLVVMYHGLGRFLYDKYSFDNGFQKYSFFGDYIYLAFDLHVPRMLRTVNLTEGKYVSGQLLDDIQLEAGKVYRRTGLSLRSFLKQSFDLDNLRKRFLGRLFLNSKDIDLSLYAYQCKKQLNYSSKITNYV